MSRRKKHCGHGGKRAGAGRKADPDAVKTAVLSVRISAAHKERFGRAVPAAGRRTWLEKAISAQCGDKR